MSVWDLPEWQMSPKDDGVDGPAARMSKTLGIAHQILNPTCILCGSAAKTVGAQDTHDGYKLTGRCRGCYGYGTVVLDQAHINALGGALAFEVMLAKLTREDGAR